MTSLAYACIKIWEVGMTNVRIQERKGNGAILSVITLITISAQPTVKRSDRNVNHLVWLDACFAGHLTPGLPELPVILDLQQQPGWVTTRQHWHAAAGLQTTSSAETSPAVIMTESTTGRESLLALQDRARQRLVQHQLPCVHPLATADQSCSSTFPLE